MCWDTSDTPGGRSPAQSIQAESKFITSQTPMVTPQCGHTFHEQLLMERLSPNYYPSIEQDLGSVLTLLEDLSANFLKDLTCEL